MFATQFAGRIPEPTRLAPALDACNAALDH